MPDDRSHSRPAITQLGREYDGVSGIYALVDPRIDVVMYVGQAESIGHRYRNHCSLGTWENNWERKKWINELARAGLVPSLRVLEVCPWPEINKAEQRLIREYRDKGQAELNISDGGEGFNISKQSRVTRDDWVALATKIKLARRLLVEIQIDLHRMASGAMATRIGNLRGRFESIINQVCFFVCDRFPDWDRAFSLFQEDPPSPDNFGSGMPP